MLSRNRTIVHTLDTKDRPSTGITSLPLIPVDGDASKHNSDATPRGTCHSSSVEHLAEQPLSSLELLRQLEAFVRELFEISKTV